VGKVLVIGYDHTLADALRGSAELKGHEVTTSATSLEAARVVRRQVVDVIVTDPATPATDDLALADELKAWRPGIRTIVLAPELSDVEVIKALRAQVFACFTAPIDPREIADMARAALNAEKDWQHGIEVVSGLPRWLTLRVECDLVSADRLTRFMTEWRSDLPSEDRDLLMTAFREMLLNAMEHGAGFDPGKVIDVTAARTARAIVFHFRDPGDGFDHSDLAHAAASCDPDQVFGATVNRAEAGLRPGGFGMLIVRQIADELVYNERGNEVLLIKYVTPPEKPS
jgi:anti-sigma regulatory factor (Ser/Thr protein kinase)/CheY-like chemotaxis protein